MAPAWPGPEGQIKAFIERLVGPLGPTAVEDLMAEAQAAAEADARRCSS
jgi:putative thioredoxin